MKFWNIQVLHKAFVNLNLTGIFRQATENNVGYLVS
jgi:hypothetical protein